MTGLLTSSKWPAILAAAALGLALLAVASRLTWRRGEATSLADFGVAPAFTLTDQLERPYGSNDNADKVVVASFIYTGCRDLCPLLTVRMRQLQERLRQERLLDGRVQLLSFTVDPDRDTPAVLGAYARRHDADPAHWRFLTGPADMLVPLIVDGFRSGVEALMPEGADHASHGDADAAPAPEVTHSGRFVLIDRRGRIRAYYDGTEVDLARVVRDIRALR